MPGLKRTVQEGPGVDPYNAAEDNPGQSRAIESSLWEVESLRNHYCPQVCAALSLHLLQLDRCPKRHAAIVVCSTMRAGHKDL